MVKLHLYLSVLLVISQPFSLAGREQYLFTGEEPVRMRIVAPLKSLKKQRGDDPQYMEGVVFLVGADGSETALDIQIKARGNFRRLETSCSFPSYWLNFKKKQVKGTIFEGQDKLKVVAHCRDSRTSFEPYIHKEYLTYKAYNLITDDSFRVRLASIDYVDTESKYRKEEQVAFFIEHTEAFEDRVGVEQIKDRYVLPSQYDMKQLCRAELFQYLIGNTDYTFFASVDECCHNGKAFLFEDGSRGHLAVPYDFDLSGLVNAPYAKPNPALKIKSVTTRVYRGVRVSDEVLMESLEYFRLKKDEMYALWRDFDPLPQSYKNRARGFVDRFYTTIEDPKKLEREIKKKMRSIEKLDKYILNKMAELEE